MVGCPFSNSPLGDGEFWYRCRFDPQAPSSPSQPPAPAPDDRPPAGRGGAALPGRVSAPPDDGPSAANGHADVGAADGDGAAKEEEEEEEAPQPTSPAADRPAAGRGRGRGRILNCKLGVGRGGPRVGLPPMSSNVTISPNEETEVSQPGGGEAVLNNYAIIKITITIIIIFIFVIIIYIYI